VHRTQDKHHAPFILNILRYVNGEDFASCYSRLGTHPVSNLNGLTSLLNIKAKPETEREWMMIFSSFTEIPEPLTHIPCLTNAMNHATPNQRLTIFKSFQPVNVGGFCLCCGVL